jgi:Ca2+/Na+ antiporter
MISTRHFFFGFTLMMIAAFFLVVGFAGILKGGYAVSLIICLCCLFVLTFYDGTELNKQDKVYRHYFSLFFFKTGEWLPLPEVSHFVVEENVNRSRLDSSLYKVKAKFLDGSEFSVGHFKTPARAYMEMERLNRFWTK